MKDKCKLCEYETKDMKTIQLSRRELIQHIQKEHQINYDEYIILVEYSGQTPICACGCGIPTNFFKGKFFKYYADHKNKVVGIYKNKKKELNKIEKIEKIENKLKTINISISDLKTYYDKWINYEINFADMEKELCLDKRTFISYWKELGYIKNKEDFRRISKKHQRIWTNKNNTLGGKKIINQELLFDIYNFIIFNKGKYTLNEIKNKFGIQESESVLYKRLKENYGDTDLKEYLKFGLSSKKEIEFYNVLKYYFGNSVIKQYKLDNKFFDMKLGDDILIEFDGDYWHSLESHKTTDHIKNNIAKKNNYILVRVKESESKNIDVLKKIMKLYENQVKRNK